MFHAEWDTVTIEAFQCPMRARRLKTKPTPRRQRNRSFIDQHSKATGIWGNARIATASQRCLVQSHAQEMLKDEGWDGRCFAFMVQLQFSIPAAVVIDAPALESPAENAR